MNNEAYLSGARAQPLEVAKLGLSLRVAFWNIERGLELDDIELFLTDWFFVKSDLEQPRDTKGSYLFAPTFPRMLVDLNNCPPEPISDHSPMTVDSPIQGRFGARKLTQKDE